MGVENLPYVADKDSLKEYNGHKISEFLSKCFTILRVKLSFPCSRSESPMVQL